MASTLSNKVLGDALLPSEGTALWIKRAVMIVAGVAALWLSATMKIAPEPVPVTLRVLVAMSTGWACGFRRGVAPLFA